VKTKAYDAYSVDGGHYGIYNECPGTQAAVGYRR
jgi:hypothetical protein